MAGQVRTQDAAAQKLAVANDNLSAALNTTVRFRLIPARYVASMLTSASREGAAAGRACARGSGGNAGAAVRGAV